MEQVSSRQKTMDGIDGGLRPAVDGQSLEEETHYYMTKVKQWVHG